MRTLVPWILLAACSPEAALVPIDLQDLLARDNPASASPHRARLVRYGEASWTPDGPPLGRPDGSPAEVELTVIDVGDQLGVLTRSGPLDLRVYLDREDLQPTPWRTTRLRSWRDHDSEIGAWLPPGLPIHAGADEGGITSVWWNSDRVELDGWVDAADLDHTWAQPPPEPVEQEAEGEVEFVMVAGDTALLDAPDGERFARLQPFTDEEPRVRWIEAEVVDRRADHTLIRLADDGVTVIGWISNEALQDTTMGGKSSGCCGILTRCGFGQMLQVDDLLPIGTWVHAHPDGPVVGRTRALAAASGRDPAAWWPWEITTAWGRSTVWVAPGGNGGDQDPRTE